MADQNVAFPSVSLEDCSNVLCQSVKGISCSDLWGGAGAVPSEIGRDDLVAQPREEVQLATPDVQGAADAVHEEECNVGVRPLAAGDHSPGVDQDCALGLAAAAARRGVGFLFADGWGNRRRNKFGFWRGRHFFVVSQLHLNGAARLQVAILALQDLRVQDVAQVLNHQLAISVDGDLPLAVDAAANTALTVVVLGRALIAALVCLLLYCNLLLGCFRLALGDDVPHSQDPAGFHLHKLEAVRGL